MIRSCCLTRTTFPKLTGDFLLFFIRCCRLLLLMLLSWSVRDDLSRFGERLRLLRFCWVWRTLSHTGDLAFLLIWSFDANIELIPSPDTIRLDLVVGEVLLDGLLVVLTLRNFIIVLTRLTPWETARLCIMLKKSVNNKSNLRGKWVD